MSSRRVWAWAPKRAPERAPALFGDGVVESLDLVERLLNLAEGLSGPSLERPIPLGVLAVILDGFALHDCDGVPKPLLLAFLVAQWRPSSLPSMPRVALRRALAVKEG